MCDNDIKDELHIFFKCPHAVMVWDSNSNSHAVKTPLAQAVTFKDCFFELLEMLLQEQQTTFVMIFQVLWK